MRAMSSLAAGVGTAYVRTHSPFHWRWERVLSPQSRHQRAGATCDDGGVVTGTRLRAGAVAGRGGDAEILSRISCSAAYSVTISLAICWWLAASWAASWSTLFRTAARPSDIALKSCTSGEGMVGAIGVTLSGAVCSRAAACCGANQPSCGEELATISLAVSP